MRPVLTVDPVIEGTTATFTCTYDKQGAETTATLFNSGDEKVEGPVDKNEFEVINPTITAKGAYTCEVEWTVGGESVVSKSEEETFLVWGEIHYYPDN